MSRPYLFFCIILIINFSSYPCIAQCCPDDPPSQVQVDEILCDALADRLNIHPDQILLYQGSGPMPYTSQEMWNIFNSIPAAQTGYYYDPAQYNNFSSAYQQILYSLKPVRDSTFKNCMGVYYQKWLNYVKKNLNIFDPITNDLIVKLFEAWSEAYAPVKSGCLTVLVESFNNSLSIAIPMFENAKQKYAWNKTVNEIQTDLDGGVPLTITLDIRVSQEFKPFTIMGKNYISPQIINIKPYLIQLVVNYEKIIVFYSFPYSIIDNHNTILHQYTPWYYPKVMSYAYDTRDNTVWSKNKSISWEKVFGQSGFMQRVCVALVIAKGVNTTISYHYINGEKDSDLQQFAKSSKSEGPFILGVIIRDIDQFIKGSEK